MGIFDMVKFTRKDGMEDSMQFKSGECNMDVFEVDDEIPIKDGIHACIEGAFVVFGGKVVATFEAEQPYLWNKYGNEMAEKNLNHYG